MFYSTEILADKRYALSTVWRAGNTAPGARSTGLRRKAVFEVDVERTCGTIKEPPGAPIALRLQGTLLYGTARIYQEQCRFVLHDSERIQRALLKLCSSLLDDKLDENAGKTRNVQIVLPNDPGFDLGFLQLPPFDFDTPEGASLLSQSRQESWTNMSLQSHSSKNSQLPPQLVLDADSSGGRQSFAGSFGYSASNASIMQDQPTPLAQRGSFGFPDEDNLLVDVGLFIDENGNIVEQDQPSEPQLPVFPAAAMQQTTKAGQTGAYGGDATEEDMVVPMIVDDDGEIVHPSVAVAAAAASANSRLDKQQTAANSSSFSPSTISGSPLRTAKQAVQQRPRHKANFVDEITQIPLSDYFHCVSNYAQNMERVVESRDRTRTMRRANDPARHRKVAYDFTFGRGVFGVEHAVNTGRVHGSEEEAEKRSVPHALAQMFSGEALAETLYGETLVRAKRRKLAADAAAAAAAASAVPSTPVGRHGVQGGYDPFGGDEEEELEIERGRQPGSALSDNPSLALNRASSALLGGSSVPGSVQHSAGTNRAGGGFLQSSAGRHSSPNFIERYSDSGLDGGLPMMLGSNAGDPFFSPVRSAAAASHGGDGAGNGNDGSNSQLCEEMRNTSAFLSLVQNKADTDGVVRVLSPSSSAACHWVAFADVVAPFQQDRPAVVGAFMSLLALATAHKLRIHTAAEDEGKIDRDILVGVPPSPVTGLDTKRKNAKKGPNGKKRAFQEMAGKQYTSDTRARSMSVVEGNDVVTMDIDG